MKKSRIFLAASAFLLAVTGVFASKAGNKRVTSNYYRTTTTLCMAAPVDLCPGFGAICRIVLGNKLVTVYKVDMGGCIVPDEMWP